MAIQEFPEEGANVKGERQPIIWPIIFLKLYENEIICTERRGERVPTAPTHLASATDHVCVIFMGIPAVSLRCATVGAVTITDPGLLPSIIVFTTTITVPFTVWFCCM